MKKNNLNIGNFLKNEFDLKNSKTPNNNVIGLNRIRKYRNYKDNSLFKLSESKLSKSLVNIFAHKRYNNSISSERNILRNSIEFRENSNSDALNDQLIKTKKLYNDQNIELKELRLTYNKLYQMHESNLKLLEKIINKAGLNINISNLNQKGISDIIDGCDFSRVMDNKERNLLTEKHLISCFKTKILEYKNLLNRKSEELNNIKNSSRVARLAKLEGENANKNVLNMNLSLENMFLDHKIDNMGTILESLNEKYINLQKKENVKINNLDDLKLKKEQLQSEIKTKDKIIGNLKEKVQLYKNELRLLSKRNKMYEEEINRMTLEKQMANEFLEDKEKYQRNEQNLKKKIESLKWENEKLTKANKALRKDSSDYVLQLTKFETERSKYLNIINNNNNKSNFSDNKSKTNYNFNTNSSTNNDVIESLKIKCSTLEEECKKYKEELEDKNNKIKELTLKNEENKDLVSFSKV